MRYWTLVCRNLHDLCCVLDTLNWGDRTGPDYSWEERKRKGQDQRRGEEPRHVELQFRRGHCMHPLSCMKR